MNVGFKEEEVMIGLKVTEVEDYLHAFYNSFWLIAFSLICEDLGELSSITGLLYLENSVGQSSTSKMHEYHRVP